MANIKQVAQLARLSVSCVSKYLKEPKSVRPYSREQIESAINELHYVPSTIARNLRTQRTGIIKIISMSITNQFFAEFFETIRTELEKNHYLGSLQTIQHHEDKRFQIRDFEQIDGVILCFIENQNTLNSICQTIPTHLPIINIHGIKSVNEFTTILTDLQRGAFDASEHLISRGSTHIAYIGGSSDSTISNIKRMGFLAALKNHSENIQYVCSQNHTYSMQSGFDAARELFEKDSTIDAIFCENDLLAAGAIHYLCDSNKRVPEDVRVIGYDNIPLASMFIPSVSSVSIPIQEISALSVSALLDHLEKKEAKDVYIKPTLVIRKSTQ